MDLWQFTLSSDMAREFCYQMLIEQMIPLRLAYNLDKY